jgi:hypothetical protein
MFSKATAPTSIIPQIGRPAAHNNAIPDDPVLVGYKVNPPCALEVMAMCRLQDSTNGPGTCPDSAGVLVHTPSAFGVTGGFVHCPFTADVSAMIKTKTVVFIFTALKM